MERNIKSKKLVGVLTGLGNTTIKTCFENANEVKYYSFNCTTEFFSEDGTIYGDKELHSLAVILNSPWSQSTESYKIEINCKDGYTPLDPEIPKWRCIYEVIGYDGISASAYGYGDTEEEALRKCKNLCILLQNKFNKDNISI